jgi:7-cyano-7-deazaguanine synthase
MPCAVVLLSGGLDSATVAALAKHRGFALYALTVDYGQRHKRELEAASAVAAALKVEQHIVQTIDLRAFGGSALTADIAVPKRESVDAPVRRAETPQNIPITYVPARNTILLSFALAYAEVIGAKDIFIGVNAVDFSGYPDCRPAFIDCFERLANLATKAGVEGRGIKIHAPLIHLSKAEIIREGARLQVDYSLTHSCYDPAPAGVSCGRCDSCLLRLEGFRQAGLTDPICYGP